MSDESALISVSPADGSVVGSVRVTPVEEIDDRVGRARQALPA